MSNIISIHYLLQFFIFIYIIPISITIETKIKFAFLNGFNVIRCSDDEIQVYQPNDNSKLYLSDILECSNKKDVLDSGYAGFKWDKLKIICSSQSDQLHEEQVITKSLDSYKGIQVLPDAQGQLGQLGKPYALHVEHNDDENEITIKSNDQPANGAYFNKNTDPKERRIYILFNDHPIICRIIFTGGEDNPCFSGNDQEAENVEHACYYNPGADEQPTINEMEAEFKQIDAAEKSDEDRTYLLHLEKPDITSVDPSNFNPINPSQNPSNKPPSKKTPNNQPSKKVPIPKKPSKPTQKSSILKTIGLIFGILLFIVLIGGIGFYMIQKHRTNQSSASASSTNIENGNNKGSSSLAPNKSDQSLPATSTNDTNRGISSIDRTSKKEKPTIQLQKSNANKRQRAAANMIFNEDI